MGSGSILINGVLLDRLRNEPMLSDVIRIVGEPTIGVAETIDMQTGETVSTYPLYFVTVLSPLIPAGEHGSLDLIVEGSRVAFKRSEET